jgi:hypothetical protein
MKQKFHEVHVLTQQLVSQLMYCTSRLNDPEFQKVSDEILALLDSYQSKVKKLKVK